MWSIDEIADALAGAIADAEARLTLEDAFHGLDGLEETALHAVLAEGMTHAGFGVLREQPFPTSPKRRPKPSERERCDLVLLPNTTLTLADPVRRDSESEQARATLFASAAAQLLTPADLEPHDALWIEVKTTGQTVMRDGVPGPNTRYSTELVRLPAKDIRKLGRERAIDHAAVLVVLFAASEEVARHDLGQAVHRWLDDDLPIRSPSIRVTPIADRIGNAAAAVCLVPVRTAAH